jgi:hypothetical protein
MSDDEILQLASQTSGAHYMDHAHVIRFARAVMRKTAGSESAPLHNAARNVLMAWDMYGTAECLRGWIDIMRDTLNAPPCHAASNAPDHREAMRQAIEALRNAHAYSVTHEEFEDGVLDVIEALSAALGDADAA